MTGGRAVRDAERPTLVACSGGADSCALALVLATRAKRAKILVGHVVHDLREAHESLADRDIARRLAESLDLEFVERHIHVRARKGNAEANARRARYRALEAMAREQRCLFVATAHHADDQMETILMRLLRGAGATGLAGLHERRAISSEKTKASKQSEIQDITLIRPMLGITRANAEALCAMSGVAWANDRTNADTSRLRAAIRHRVVPILRVIGESQRGSNRAPLEHLAASSAALRAAGRLLDDECASIVKRGVRVGGSGGVEPSIRWPRAELRSQPPGVLSGVIKMAAMDLLDGHRASRLSARTLNKAATLILDDEHRPRRMRLAGVELRVTARDAVLTRVAATPPLP
ncbi:MAG: tRNA lysidine(34) synthetase TilS [Phycisphaerales bacterium]